jgi:hypothetical protein
MSTNKPKSKTMRACINRPTEDVLKVRAMQMRVPKQELVGHILKHWCSHAHSKSKAFQLARETLA